VLTVGPVKVNGDIRELTRDEGRALLEDAAQRHFNMGGQEFVRRWKAGEFVGRDDPHLMHLAMLLPLAE
jgi:hypothetical protein